MIRRVAIRGSRRRDEVRQEEGEEYLMKTNHEFLRFDRQREQGI